jgi:hypothetical protein
MWLASTASASAPLWPETRTRGLLPSGLATLIVPLPELAQYRWPGTAPREPPVPVSAAVAVAAGFFPAAVKVAVTVPELVGANRTLTVQDLPGRRPLRLQVLPVMENAAAPANRSRSVPLARLPVLARVKVLEAVCPVVTCM